MKRIHFMGNSLTKIREFPEDAKHDAGYQLELLQSGREPNDSKAMPSIGKGVEELRVWAESGTFRVIYTARVKEAIYVLHAFQKKTQATSKHGVQLAKQRYSELMRSRR